MIETVFWNDPSMLAVIKCESNYKHYLSSGEVIEGPTEDYGVLQIHAPTHQKKMEAMGMDIMDIHDNISYGKMLHDELGSEPWVCKKRIALAQ